jgi:methionyl-tRNA formyltransferase
MKLLFCGTPEFGVPTLRRLCEEEYRPALVITQPDRPRGRGLTLTPPPVKLLAQELGLPVEQPPVEQPEKLRGEAGRRLIEQHQPEAVVIVGYGQLIPGDLLTIPRHGWINLHASLLPKYRGAAPARPSPASPPCGSTRVWTPAPSCCRRKSRFAKTIPPLL